MVDPREFCSDRLPIEHFDSRFSDDNLAFWVPRLVAAAAIDAGSRVLDVGCGTGGFSREIARLTSARVTGCDASARFIDFARAHDDTEAGEWIVADAEQLP